MFHSLPRWPMPAALLAATLATPAQTTAPAATASAVQALARATRPDALDANASVPPVAYESSFAQYRRLSDEKLISWREANDTVTRIGGWRVYAREAQQPDPPPGQKPMQGAPPAAGPAKPVPAGHEGHKAPTVPGAAGAAR